MNAVEIEEAISALAEQPFDAAEFPYLFLQAFGNKETTLKRLRKGESNKYLRELSPASSSRARRSSSLDWLSICPPSEPNYCELLVAPASSGVSERLSADRDKSEYQQHGPSSNGRRK
jgi:hypothetical protein